ncbi:MAG: PEP-CTERM sorting domain-containing protein [Candidatus Omnitrophota bacterium]
MNKISVLFAFILAAFAWTPAYADTASTYFSSSQGGASETVFNLNSALWMYTHLPLSGTNGLTNLWITSPSNASYTYVYASPIAQNKWHDLTSLTYSDSYSWNNIKELGTWHTVFSYSYPSPDGASSGIIESSFTLVPEPVSGALFLLGGGALFAIRKKKG